MNFYNQRTVEFAKVLKGKNLYPFFRSISGSEATSVQLNGKDMVMIGSNNYLGLTHHPHVIEQTIKAVEKYGTGCTGSRFLNGSLDLHAELEYRMAKYLNQEAALCFSTGMQTNLGSISALCGPRDLILGDSENHASIIDGTRLSFASVIKYRHSDMENLEELLVTNRNKYKNIFIITDGVFSMTGSLAPLPKIVELAEKYGAYIYLDDAHGIGVMGELGRGTMNHFQVEDKMTAIMGTFSKSFASIGGVLSGSEEVINYVKHTARSFMFSASMPPSAAATVIGCLDVIESSPEIFETLWDNVTYMRRGLQELGFFTYGSQTPIIPVLVGDDTRAMQVAMELHERGVFATPVISPAVPKDEALIRTSYMATHTRDELDRVLEVFAEIKKKIEFPKTH